MSKSYTVYKHTSPNGKVYIGITSLPVNLRWQNGNGYKGNKYFYSAIQKYGWDNFAHDILYENVDKAVACEAESYLINLYQSNNSKYGYNHSSGGEFGAKGCKHSNKRIIRHKQDFIVLNGDYINLMLQSENPSDLIALYTYFIYISNELGECEYTIETIADDLNWSLYRTRRAKNRLIAMNILDEVI